jgi:hypothetical protein
MDLFWKKITGRLRSTRKQDRKETTFLIASAKSKKIRLAFRDEFDTTIFDSSSWKPGFYFPNEKLVRHYSFYNEQQWNNEGKNTFFRDHKLQIYTRRENAKGLAWHPTHGFMERDFPFTADVVQTAESFKQQGGIFKAKIRCTGHINHAFWLGSSNKQLHINIFHFNGSEIQMGFKNKEVSDSVTVKGIKPTDYYIYGFEWNKDELIWSVNNVVVLRKRNILPYESLFLIFNSFIPERTDGDEGVFEVDWVRVYQFNK